MSKDKMKGLSSKEAIELQEKYGKNELKVEKRQTFLGQVIHSITEPTFLLLIITAVIYFILGEPRDGLIMLISVLGILTIDIIQEWKTDKTLNALKDLSAPHIRVIRDGEEKTISSTDLVPGDLMMIAEGVKIPADGEIIRNNTICIDESSLTGESEGVWKIEVNSEEKNNKDYWRKDYCYAGTLVTQGSAIAKVEKIGVSTEYGKIGKNVAFAPIEVSPLQKQTRGLVKVCAIFAGILFAAVSIITYINISNYAFQDRIIKSILSGVTLAMAMIPEEFPVVLTVFLSMGAWRLAKKNSLVRKLPSVETLGAVSVLCVDKTGTITKNQMEIVDKWINGEDKNCLVETMGLGCEDDTYDPMEKAMLSYCEKNGFNMETLFSKRKFVKEYIFSNDLKMMGHVWNNDGTIEIALKGSPERILTICNIDDNLKKEVEKQMENMSKKGLRVIGVAKQNVKTVEEVPEEITKCNSTFCGLVGLEDPARETVKKDIETCTKAGIRVVMITGDNGITAKSIAKKVGIPNCDNIITGDELEEMTDEELKEKVKNVSIFSRVIPEHKMRIVKAFKENGEIVAMTGDGVNDAPALKYSDIGIAMGKRGSEVSREAADLILMDDNFSTIVDTVRDGRRIYDNIQKAVGYIFTIHLPIAMSALIAPLLHVDPSNLLLLPVHIVLMELIIDPTCSIVLERQPEEKGIMDRKPRDPNKKILTPFIFIKSIIQGIVLFLASFITYYLTMQSTSNIELARAMGVGIIMIGNLLLVHVNCSETEFAFSSIKKLFKDKVMWSATIITIIAYLIFLYTPVSGFIKMAPLTLLQFIQVVLTAFVCVGWYEVVKIFKINKSKVGK